MSLSIAQLRQLLHSEARRRISDSRDRQSYQYLVRMQTWIDRAEALDLEPLYRLDDSRVDQIDALGDVAELLHGVEQHS